MSNKATPTKAQQEAAAEQEIPDYLKVAGDVFEKESGETFGGESDILYLEEDQAAGPFTCLGHRVQDLGNGIAPATVYEAKDVQGANWRMPIASSFKRQAEMANLSQGDTFFVKRLADAVKKSGAGKGKPMQMYAIKITRRAAQASA